MGAYIAPIAVPCTSCGTETAYRDIETSVPICKRCQDRAEEVTAVHGIAGHLVTRSYWQNIETGERIMTYDFHRTANLVDRYLNHDEALAAVAAHMATNKKEVGE